MTDDKIGTAVAGDHRAAAEKAGRPFLPVSLFCDREVNLQRAVTEERLTGHKKKLVDTKLLTKFLDTETLFEWPDSVRIDVTELAPEQTARKIAEEVARVASC